MKKIEIKIPGDCILVQDGDKYIIKKKDEKPKTWKEFCKNYPLHENKVYFNDYGEINLNIVDCGKRRTTPNWIINKQEAEAFLALMQLRQLRKAWVGDWEIKYDWNDYHCIINHKNNIIVARRIYTNGALSFPTEEMAEDFLNCFKDLCETAKILL